MRDRTKTCAERTFECLTCHVIVTKRVAKTVRYCSRDCFHVAPKPGLKKGKTITCKQCSASFYAPRGRVQDAAFCCPECHNKFQGRGKVDIICQVCGKAKTVSPIYANRKYCSIACRNRDPRHTEMLRSLNQIQQAGNPTKIEVIGYQILDAIGIDYLAQHILFEKFCVDAFVPSKNLVIQFDGDYWHGNPDKFPILDNRQKSRCRLDLSQDAYMKKAGVSVLRLWECDIKTRPDFIKGKIESLIK